MSFLKKNPLILSILILLIFIVILPLLLRIIAPQLHQCLLTTYVIGNTCIFRTIHHWNLHLVIYILILILSAGFYGILKITKKRTGSKVTVKNIIKKFLVLFLALLFYCQTQTTIAQFLFEHRHVSGKTTDEKYHAIFNKEHHDFAEFCKIHIPKHASVYLISDLTLDEDPGHFELLELAYFAYPIYFSTNTTLDDADTIVVYKASNPLTRIPKEFSKHIFYNDTNIIAFREN